MWGLGTTGPTAQNSDSLDASIEALIQFQEMPRRFQRRAIIHDLEKRIGSLLNAINDPHPSLHLLRYYSSPSTSSSRVIFSGIQPTGIPHIGNYLGALRQWAALQNEAASETKLFYSIVDLHAITVPQDAVAMRVRRRESLAALLAIGLNPERSTLFYQSSVGTLTLLLGSCLFTEKPARYPLIVSLCGF